MKENVTFMNTSSKEGKQVSVIIENMTENTRHMLPLILMQAAKTKEKENGCRVSFSGTQDYARIDVSSPDQNVIELVCKVLTEGFFAKAEDLTELEFPVPAHRKPDEKTEIRVPDFTKDTDMQDNTSVQKCYNSIDRWILNLQVHGFSDDDIKRAEILAMAQILYVYTESSGIVGGRAVLYDLQDLPSVKDLLFAASRQKGISQIRSRGDVVELLKRCSDDEIAALCSRWIASIS